MGDALERELRRQAAEHGLVDFSSAQSRCNAEADLGVDWSRTAGLRACGGDAAAASFEVGGSFDIGARFAAHAAAEAPDDDGAETLDALELLGLDRLKALLAAKSLKCGGTLHERATRLLRYRTCGALDSDRAKAAPAKAAPKAAPAPRRKKSGPADRPGKSVKRPRAAVVNPGSIGSTKLSKREAAILDHCRAIPS
ncbi:hypothetical protein M885DRAFT_507815 [Pelagophyceae sp. CCMP2097]|nr:hypothetical protein M885DRAFT_507815 [Pelagophyceae sp. CCMP2097]